MRVLRGALVEIYKSDEPDALTVILQADGFDDLLERYEYLDLDPGAGRLDRRPRPQPPRRDQGAGRQHPRPAATRSPPARRSSSARGIQLEAREAELDAARAAKADALAAVEDNIERLEGDIGDIQGDIQAQIQAAAGRRAGDAAPCRPARSRASRRAGSSGPSAARSSPRSAGAGAACTRASTSRLRRARRSAPSPTATSSSPRPPAATATTPASTTAAGSPRATPTSRPTRSPRASVSQGDVIGYVGCTGSCFGDHLHFEVRINGAAVDPMGYL